MLAPHTIIGTNKPCVGYITMQRVVKLYCIYKFAFGMYLIISWNLLNNFLKIKLFILWLDKKNLFVVACVSD